MTAAQVLAQLQPEDAVDLHMHTFASDGRWEPEELIKYLADHNFKLIAVADHDQMFNVPLMAELAAQAGIYYIPAVEMTTRWEDRQVHVLIYGIDPQSASSAPFMEHLRLQQQQLADTSEVMLKLLDQHGRRIPGLMELPEIKRGLPLTPHRVFTSMIANGHGNNLYQAHNIIRGMGEPVLVDVPIADTVAAAHAAGGVAIIAHPGRDEGAGILDEEKLDRMLADIPIDGVEGHYRSYKDADTARYRDFANQRGLLVSAGSDSHWPGFPVNPTPHPAKWIAPLLARLGYEVTPWEGEPWSPKDPASGADSDVASDAAPDPAT